MLSKRVRLLGIVLAVSISSSVFAGCTKSKPAETQKTDDKTPITMTMFDKNTGDPFGNDPVSQEITKKTGIKLEIQQPTGNPLEKLNLMLTSGDLPDIVLMDRGNDIVNKYISAGALIPLDDLIDKYGPNIKKMYGDTLTKIRYSDGKNYYLSNWFGKDPSPVFAVMMRKDLIKEVAPDKADGSSPFTTDEFEAALKKIKELHPTLNGHETIPMSLWSENMGAVTGTFKAMFGIEPYYNDNGSLKYDVENPKYLNMIKYMNKLYTEGLMDKEWPVNKTQLFKQKLSNGYVFSTAAATWDLGDADAILKKANPDSIFYPYKVVAPGEDPSKLPYGTRSTLGWDAIGITKACKDPVKAIKAFDYMVSEEGQYLLKWGIEGVSWDMKDGKHVPKPEVLQGFKDDWGAYSKKTGIRKWTYFTKNGNGADGTPYDLPGQYQKDDITQFALKTLGDTFYDTSAYDALTPASGTPEALNTQKVTDLINQAIPEMVCAASQDKAVERYNKLVTDLKAAGLAQVEKVINDNYKKRMDLWKK